MVQGPCTELKKAKPMALPAPDRKPAGPRVRLEPGNIRQVWNWLRPKLEYVKDIRGGTWRPEDVYAACVNNEAFLYTAPEGFVALKPMVDDYSGDRFLLVWIAQGDGGDCIDKYQEQLIEIARDAGYNRLQFWRRPHGESESKGWKKAYTIYELEIPA